MQSGEQVHRGMSASREGVSKLALDLSALKFNPTQLIEGFAQSKRAVEASRQSLSDAQSAVAGLAAKLRDAPKDTVLLREFERVKQAARAAKDEFLSGQSTTELLRRSMADQGISVAKLAEEYRRLKVAYADASAPSMATRMNSSIGAKAPTASEAHIVQPANSGNLGGAELSGIDKLVSKISTMGHVASGVLIGQQLLPYITALGQLSDKYVGFTSQLKLATDGVAAFARGQDDVVRISAVTSSGLAETAQLYARLSQSVSHLGISQSSVAKITEVVGLSLKVSGATAQESASAILQLSQAFGSGVLRGEEFNAVNEASPRLMNAIAESIGRPKEQLRSLAETGQLTAKLLALALPDALTKLRGEAEQMPLTIGQAYTQLQNKMMLMVGGINNRDEKWRIALRRIRLTGYGFNRFVASCWALQRSSLQTRPPPDRQVSQNP